MELIFPLNEQYDSEQEIIDLVVSYKGDNKFINSLKGTIMFKGTLSEKQFEAARKFFISQRRATTNFNTIVNDRNIRKYVIKQGIKAYVDLLKTDKKFLFTQGDVKIDIPSKTWAQRNITDLEFLKDHLSPKDLEKEITLMDGTSGKFIDLINELIDRLTNNLESYQGFIDKSGDWSILNKIDTNYSNWADMISEYEIEKKLGDGTITEKIDEFFKDRDVETFFLPEDLEYLTQIEDEKNIRIPQMSFAEYSIFQDSKKEYKKTKEIIGHWTKEGDKEEANFKGYLYIQTLFRESPSIKPEDVKDFSSHGNRVDVVFGIDMMVNMLVPISKENRVEKRWVPIQVKTTQSKAKTAFILSLGIGGLSVYRRKVAKTGFNFGDEDMENESDTDFGTYAKKDGHEYSFNKTFISLYGPLKEE